MDLPGSNPEADRPQSPLPDVRLRPFTEADYELLASWLTTPFDLMVWGGSRFKLPLTAEQLDRHLIATRSESPSRYVYTAELDGQPIGHIELNAVSRKHSCATLCRVLVGKPRARGRGLGQTMVERALEVAFDRLGLHRIDLNVYDQNAAAIACYERVGFCQESLLREARRFGDERWSLVHMSILAREWRDRRGDDPPEANRS